MYIKRVVFVLAVLHVGSVFAVDENEQNDIVYSITNDSKTNVSITWAKGRKGVKFLSGRFPSPGNTEEAVARGFLARYAGPLGIADVQHELTLAHIDDTPRGKFVRFSRRRGDIEVVGDRITVRLQDGVVAAVANNFHEIDDVATVPVISAEAAVITAKNAINTTQHPVTQQLVILPWDGATSLVYRIDFPLTSTATLPTRYSVYVDATDGAILLIDNKVRTSLPAVGSGPGLDGVEKSFPTVQKNGVYFLRTTLDAVAESKTYTASGQKVVRGELLSDSDNVWTDRIAVDAYYYANYSYEFYKSRFGNFTWYGDSGFDQAGGIVSVVHYGKNYENAFWDGRRLVYGDGGADYYPLAGSIEVVAHEFTHGVTDAAVGFLYCNESGALSESWSDVFSMFVSMAYGDADPYLVGEDVMKIAERRGAKGYYAIRRLDDPAFRTDSYAYNDYEVDDPLGSWGQPADTSEQYRVRRCSGMNDNGGVHVNSGIPNRAAYLITTAIGDDKAAQIYYYAMFYLFPTAKFADARAALEWSAIDLYGNGAEADAVSRAFDEVGVGGGGE